jgi:ubiquitin-like 1-activating enzyme E1 B
VLKGRLALLAPSLSCGSFLYEEGQDLEEDEVTFYRSLLPRPLASLPGGGLVNGSIVEVSDQEQQFKAQLVISHREDWDEEVHPEGFELSGSLPAAEAEQQPAAPTATASEPAALPTSAATAAKGPKAELQETADGVVVLTSDDEEAAEAAAATGKGKRKASELAEDDGQDGKRARVQEGTDVVDLLDDSD